MQKPAIPGLANLPGMGAMNETLDFVKNLWGGVSKPTLGLPGMVMPTLSVEEIQKQIKDLKAVEAWLNVNANMVRGTIQALEVQAGTITTLQSMGQALGAAVNGGKDKKQADTAADDADEENDARTAARRKTRAARNEELKKPAAKAKPAEKAAPAAEVPNPALWWNMLQDQFKAAVTQAMGPEAMSAAAKNAMQTMMRQPGVKDAMAGAVKTVVKGAAKTAAKKAAGVARKAVTKKK